MPGSHILTNAQWDSIEHLARGKPSDRGRTGSCPRHFVNAVLWIMFLDRQWSELPDRFGEWKVAHQRFLRWRAKEVWDDVFKTLTASKNNEDADGKPKVDYIGLYRKRLRNKTRIGKTATGHRQLNGPNQRSRKLSSREAR